MVGNFINYKGMATMSQYPDWTPANHISSVRKTGESDLRARKHMLDIPLGNGALSGKSCFDGDSSSEAAQSEERYGRAKRGRGRNWNVYIYLCHLLFLLSSLKCHGCLCHIYSVCPWHFTPFKNLFICIAVVFQSVEISTHSILHVEFVFFFIK